MKILLHPDQLVDPGDLIEIPSSWKQHISPWAITELRQYDFGTILTQHFFCRQYQIYIYYFVIKQKRSLYVSSDAPTIALQATLQGKIPGTIKGGLDVLLEANTYSLVYLPAGIHQVNFDAETIESIHIEMETNYIADLTDEWIRQEELLAMISNAHGKGYLFPRIAVDYRVKDLINKLRYSHKEAIKFKFQSLIMSLLSVYLDSIDEKKSLKQLPEVAHRDILVEIWQTIKLNPDIHYTVADFARNHYISESALKDGFQNMFGFSFSNFVLQQCMEKARYLLRNSQAMISEIASQIGYMDNGNFTRAYKKYYRISPSKERRKKS